MSVGEDISAHATARGMLLLAGKDIVSTLGGVIFFILIARFLPSVADLGVLTGLQTIISMFVIFSGLGLPYAATRFISTFIGSGKKERAQGLYPLVFILTISFAAISSFVLYGSSSEISSLLFQNSVNTKLIQLASLDVFLLSLLTMSMFLLSASMEFKKVAFILIINSVVKYPLSFALLLSGSGLYGIILGFVVGDGISVLVFMYILGPKLFKNRKAFLSSIPELRSLLRYSLIIYGSQILAFLSFRIDVYLLMIMSTFYLVGIYAPAVFVSGVFLILLTAMDQALLPVTSRIYGRSGITSFKDSCRYVSRYLFLFYFPLGFAFAASTPSLVTVTMGERFIDSVYPVMILIISITLTSPVIVVGNLLRSADKNSIILKSAAVSLIVQVFISIITIPFAGVLGVSAARFISRFVFFALPVNTLNKMGGFEIDKAALKNGLGSSILISVIILSVNSLVSGPFSLPLQYIVAFLSFLIFLRITHALNKKDIELVDKIMLGKMRWLTDLVSKIVLN